MPHFTLQNSPQGPVLNAYVGVSIARETALTSSGQPTPNPQLIRALVDTGASITSVDPSVLTALNLTATGNTLIHTPSTGNKPVPADLFDIGLLIPAASNNQSALIISILPVICAELLVAQGFHALIGRDVLAQCLLIYNGTTKLFTICY